MPVSSLSAGAFPAVAHSSIPEDHPGELSYMQAWHLEIPAKSMGVGKHSMDISIIFCRIGRKPPEGLSQENIVYIEYFHIEIFIYFHINESSQCALGRIFFIRISIFLVDFFAPEVKWLAKSRAFAFSSLFLFLFLHREQCFTT